MAEKKQQQKQKQDQHGEKKELIGIVATKEKQFSEWYSEVITKADMIDYYDISGCYILKPWSFAIWENIKDWFDAQIKQLGVQNSYFPVFVSERALNVEKSHVEGFAPEVAWVTRSGKSPLAEPIAVRPTSETIMYPAFSKWIRSHRDLPLKINQWTNVVRWEFKDPTPFLRTREFLWQEGHTVFATLKEASEEVLTILDLYSKVYEYLLAVPVVKGQKTEEEKFPGGLYTTTVEAFIPTAGRGIQAATSHCLGQNFSKMFNIQFEGETKEMEHAWQNSWGLTTRSIGIMTMVHGDDKGLVLPPRVAPLQFVIVPIWMKDSNIQNLITKATEIFEGLKGQGLRGFLDSRQNYNPGWKFNHWEMKGVPVRVNFGPQDLEKGTVELVRRDTGAKETIPQSQLAQRLPQLLDEIHDSLFQRAKKARDDALGKASNWTEFMAELDKRHIVLAPSCDTNECEGQVKDRSKADSEKAKPATETSSQAASQLKDQVTAQGDKVRKLKAEKAAKDVVDKEVATLLELKKKLAEAEKGSAPQQTTSAPTQEPPKEEGTIKLSGAAKSLCKPFDQAPLPSGTKCFQCGKAAKCTILWGRSY